MVDEEEVAPRPGNFFQNECGVFFLADECGRPRLFVPVELLENPESTEQAAGDINASVVSSDCWPGTGGGISIASIERFSSPSTCKKKKKNTKKIKGKNKTRLQLKNIKILLTQ